MFLKLSKKFLSQVPKSVVLAGAMLIAGLLNSQTVLGGVVFNATYWRWNDLTNHMGKIASSGYTAIQVSPHQQSCGGGVSNGYDPYDFRVFDSRFGSEGELRRMIKAAHRHGVHVYADMVLNHMCPLKYDYPRFSYNDFHHFGGIEGDRWHDEWWLTHGDFLGLADLTHESPYVRGELFKFLVKSSDIGFDGFRWDAAKHIPIWYFRDHVLWHVNSWGKYNYGEVVNGDPKVLHRYIEAGMAVTDFALYDAIKEAFKFGGDLRRVDGAGYAKINGAKALTFVENHDWGPAQNREMAYAFLASYVGYPSFFKVQPDDQKYANMVWVNKNLARGHYHARVAEKDVLVFERQGHLIAAFNQTGSWQKRWVYTTMKNTRLHDYAGRIGKVHTNNKGWVEISIPPMSYLMLGRG